MKIFWSLISNDFTRIVLVGGFFSVFNNNWGIFPCSFAGNSAYHLPAMQASAVSIQYVAGNNISCASVSACQSPPYIRLKSNSAHIL